MSIAKRNLTIVRGLQSGRTFRDVAASAGVHHRTAQRVAARGGFYSARSPAALETDFNTKGVRVYRKVQGI